MGPHTCHLSHQELGRRATKKVQGQPRLYSEFHVRLGYRVRLYLQKKKGGKVPLEQIWVTFYSLCIQVWIVQVISDLGEGRSEASEVMWLQVGWEGSWEWQNEAAEDWREPWEADTWQPALAWARGRKMSSMKTVLEVRNPVWCPGSSFLTIIHPDTRQKIQNWQQQLTFLMTGHWPHRVCHSLVPGQDPGKLREDACSDKKGRGVCDQNEVSGGLPPLTT